jgi:hypothetical protein
VSKRVAPVSVLITEPLLMPFGVCVESVAAEFVLLDVLLQLANAAMHAMQKKYFFIPDF